jgi:hypothetical protein
MKQHILNIELSLALTNLAATTAMAALQQGVVTGFIVQNDTQYQLEFSDLVSRYASINPLHQRNQNPAIVLPDQSSDIVPGHIKVIMMI